MMLSPSQTGPRRAPFNFSELFCGKKARAHPCPAQIGNRLDRTDERARTAAMVSRSQPALDSFPQYHYSRGPASSSGAASPAASGRFHRTAVPPGSGPVSTATRSSHAGFTAPPRRPGSGPSDACEHRIGERMARVAHSIMTYCQRNPGIKRKSKSTHHHPESPMCIDPLGAHGSRRPITAPHRKPRNLREIWRLLRIVTFSHVQLRVVPPFNRAGRGEDHATALDRTVTRSLGKVRSRDARNSLRPPP